MIINVSEIFELKKLNISIYFDKTNFELNFSQLLFLFFSKTSI